MCCCMLCCVIVCCCVLFVCSRVPLLVVVCVVRCALLLSVGVCWCQCWPLFYVIVGVLFVGVVVVGCAAAVFL